MKNKKLKLEEAVRDHYKVTPLDQDFSQNVADKIFGPKPVPKFVLGTWVYYVIGVLMIAVVMITFSFLVKLQLSPSFILIIVPIILYFAVSIKEASVLARYSEHMVS